MDEDVKQPGNTNISYPQMNASVCPHCGYCPTCGRPYHNTYPTYPQYPGWPYNPIVYCTSGGVKA
jgi:hypothetical protein